MSQHYTLSTNIQRDKKINLNYINTPNTNQVFKHIRDSFRSGIHSFTIIGSYGTGKSSFLWALEQHLSGQKIFDSGIWDKDNGVVIILELWGSMVHSWKVWQIC